MTEAGRRALLLLLLIVTGWKFSVAWRRERFPSFLVDAPPLECPVAVELSGLGVACLSPAEAESRALEAGDLVDRRRGGARPGRMVPSRIALFDVPIDPNRASAAELESLPGVGPTLAERIVAARDARPFRRVEEVRRVPGLGGKRWREIRPRLRVHAEAPRDSMPLPAAGSTEPVEPAEPDESWMEGVQGAEGEAPR